MKVWIVEQVDENDGGYLPDSRWICRVFSSEELAEQFVEKQDKEWKKFEIDDWEIDYDC